MEPQRINTNFNFLIVTVYLVVADKNKIIMLTNKSLNHYLCTGPLLLINKSQSIAEEKPIKH
jgi:hypothetical protein